GPLALDFQLLLALGILGIQLGKQGDDDVVGVLANVAAANLGHCTLRDNFGMGRIAGNQGLQLARHCFAVGECQSDVGVLDNFAPCHDVVSVGVRNFVLHLANHFGLDGCACCGGGGLDCHLCLSFGLVFRLRLCPNNILSLG